MDGQTQAPNSTIDERHRLTAGTLALSYCPDPAHPGPLFVVGERINPRRAFLFVSTVLGRHIPVVPSGHRAVLEALAARALPHVAAGPVLVMSYAETAVGLGAGVARAIRAQLPDRDVLFLPTTRHAIDGQVWLDFSEHHSHAQEHLILTPAPHPAMDRTVADRTLILVDDETTTGRTFSGLAAALTQQAGLGFDRIVLLTLTDWSDGAAVNAVNALQGITYAAAETLMQGCWNWEHDPDVPTLDLPGPIPPGAPTWQPGTGWMHAPRQGEAETPRLSLDALSISPPCPGEKVLVIGTGEHVWQPFLIAEAFEASGADTRFIATTRSPVLPGRAITEKLIFPDHFGIGIEMYLHNVDPTAWDRILLCTETTADGVPDALRFALGHGQILEGTGTLSQMLL